MAISSPLRIGPRARKTDAEMQLRYVQPALIGLIDGTVSTLAPMFAAAYVSGSRAALLVGLAAALGAASRWACRKACRMTAS